MFSADRVVMIAIAALFRLSCPLRREDCLHLPVAIPSSSFDQSRTQVRGAVRRELRPYSLDINKRYAGVLIDG
ncbi:MAG: hypothetical protein QUV08_03085 [Parasphingorhabdus sp.]|nr:hypothetical protein [Parasphingorhabdus sp.]|tara:strand:+ start:339 stop:557 length:219 start_codon:yes stop_codon:yes gene_type:complete